MIMVLVQYAFNIYTQRQPGIKMQIKYVKKIVEKYKTFFRWLNDIMYLMITELLCSEIRDVSILSIVSFFLKKRFLSVKFLALFSKCKLLF